MYVEVVAYRPQWASLFNEESARIKNILQENAINIFHIDSTAVEGLAAKPIIDLLPVVKDIDKVDACAAITAKGVRVAPIKSTCFSLTAPSLFCDTLLFEIICVLTRPLRRVTPLLKSS